MTEWGTVEFGLGVVQTLLRHEMWMEALLALLVAVNAA